ncbi:MAG: hypothetical protein V1678_04410 [Candidatus Aenigmatarchaeota archaeon]
MKIIFDKRNNSWKVNIEGSSYMLKSNDFLVLSSLRDIADRKFHHVSELMLSSRFDDNFFKEKLDKLRKTSLVRQKGKYYRISCFGEFVVDSIRSNEVEIMNGQSGMFFGYLKRLVGFEAR